MRQAGYQRRGTRLDVQMTPMIDVVFQLLIFFVCTVNMRGDERRYDAQWAESKVETPGGAGSTAAEAEAPDLKEVEIAIEARAGVGPDGRPVAVPTWKIQNAVYTSRAEVAARLDALAAVGDTARTVPIYIRVADEVAVGDAVATHDLCRGRGFTEVSFVAR